MKDGDSRLNSAPILEEGRTAFISFTEMTELLKGLGNPDLQWQESETVQALGPYKRIPFSDAGYGTMVISIARSNGTARAILTPKKICQTFKPLDSALKTPRAL